MKKQVSILLAQAMLLSLSVPAFAADANNQNKATANKDSNYSASINVNGTYLSEKKSDEIISVNVEWKDMNFIYYASQQGTWEPTSHTYSGDKTAGWNKTTSDITVTNHSNVDVTATLSYTQSVASVTGDLSEETLNLESAAQDKYMGNNADQAPSQTSTFTIGGKLDSSSAKDLGTITVTLAEKENSSNGDDGDSGEGEDNDGCTVVSDIEALRTALNAGGNIKLGANIETDGEVCGPTTGSFELDLNGKTLTCTQFTQYANTTGTICNGNITACNNGWYNAVLASGNLIIHGCTLTGSGFFALKIEGGDVAVADTTLNGGVYLNTTSNGGTSTLNATENVTIKKDSSYDTTGIWVVPGCTATFGVDPTNLMYSSNTTTITQQGSYTWTVGPQ